MGKKLVNNDRIAVTIKECEVNGNTSVKIREMKEERAKKEQEWDKERR